MSANLARDQASPLPFLMDTESWEIVTGKAGSFILSYAYHHADGVLRITFKGGKSFDHAAVPATTFSGMKLALSAGTFYHAEIKNIFDATQVLPQERERADVRTSPQAIVEAPVIAEAPATVETEVEVVELTATATPPREEAELESKALTLAQRAQITIADQETYDQAADVFETVLLMEREITEHYRPLKTAAFTSHKLICEAEKKVLKPVLGAKETLSLSMGQFDAQQQRARAAEEQRLQLVHEQEAKAVALEDAIEAESAGATQEEVLHILQAPAPAQRAVVAPTYAKRNTTTDVWRAYPAIDKGVELNEAQRLDLVIAAAKANPEAYRSCLLLNMSEINTRAKKQNVAFNVPGFVAQPIRKATGNKTGGK